MIWQPICRTTKEMIHCEEKLLIQLAGMLSDTRSENVAILCGDLSGDQYYIRAILSARNEDGEPRKRFYVSSRQMGSLLARAQKKGYFLLGIAHSHPGDLPAEPSAADIQSCRHTINAVFHPASRRLTWFDSQGAKSGQWIPLSHQSTGFEASLLPA